MRLFFSAGEASGDIHGASLIRAIRNADPSVRCEGLGGRRMEEAGMELRHDLAGQAIMGFGEVVRSFRSIRRLFLDTVEHLKASRPETLVLIDYPGFNIRLAEQARRVGIPVVYYISPQVWAWKRGRIHTLAKVVDRMLVIFPFEEPLYRQAGVDCVFVGHPLLDAVESASPAPVDASGMVIGLLPGSREQEILRHMPVMTDVARGILEAHPEARFLVPCVDERRETQVRSLAGTCPVHTMVGGMYEVLRASRFCLVASGTATLETALFGVPMLILYKTSPLNYRIARSVVRIKHIGLANIVAGREIVPEFIQHEACRDRVLPTALELIDDTPRRARMPSDLAEVRRALGERGASARAAQAVLEIAGRKRHA